MKVKMEQKMQTAEDPFKRNKTVDILRAQVLEHGIPEEIVVDDGQRGLSVPTSYSPKNGSNM